MLSFAGLDVHHSLCSVEFISKTAVKQGAKACRGAFTSPVLGLPRVLRRSIISQNRVPYRSGAEN